MINASETTRCDPFFFLHSRSFCVLANKEGKKKISEEEKKKWNIKSIYHQKCCKLGIPAVHGHVKKLKQILWFPFINWIVIESQLKKR